VSTLNSNGDHLRIMLV